MSVLDPFGSLGLPVVGAATLYRSERFFPAFMVVLGVHYLPFVFPYGVRMLGLLACLIWAGGLTLGLWVPGSKLRRLRARGEGDSNRLGRGQSPGTLWPPAPGGLGLVSSWQGFQDDLPLQNQLVGMGQVWDVLDSSLPTGAASASDLRVMILAELGG